MSAARLGHSATLLLDGRVLVAGGAGDYWNPPDPSTAELPPFVDPATVELYDPAADAWSRTGNMLQLRGGYTATLLLDGRVLVAGGWSVEEDGSSEPLTSAELYDPATASWAATGSMVEVRTGGQTASLLPDGRVLVAGGVEAWHTVDPQGNIPPADIHSSAELYDPSTGTWTATGSMTETRSGHTATLLDSGAVLVAGGLDAGDYVSSHLVSSAELYDAASGTWTATGSMAVTRYDHTATRLLDGRVLVAGGFECPAHILSRVDLDDPSRSAARLAAFVAERQSATPSGWATPAACDETYPYPLPSDSAELYDPVEGTWAVTGPMVGTRADHAAVLMLDGRVLVVGVWMADAELTGGMRSSAELYDPATGRWTATERMLSDRESPTATLVADGRVLVVGGWGALDEPNFYGFLSDGLATAELYDPAGA